ncbi:MAG: nucleoside recognition domain-containing protein, partial [Anaerolineae bacterium]
EAAGSLVSGLVAKEVVISTMSQIYLGADEGGETVLPTVVEDLQAIAVGFGEATVLTVQELVNIVPRTVNIITGVTLADAYFLGAAGDEDATTGLQSALMASFTPLTAVAFCAFVLLYVPCMSTLAALRHEFGTRWMLIQTGYSLLIAWAAAVVVYQGGLLLGLG